MPMTDNSPADPARKPQRGSSPTLADVAFAASVSVSTAGRVLRDQGWPVEAKLRERVLAAANELGYVPNVMARSFRTGAPALVGLVTGNMLDPYYGEIGEAVTRYAESTSKMLVMVCNMQRDPKLEIDYCRRLWEHRVAGLILTGGGFDQFTHSEEFAKLLAQMERGRVTVVTLTPRGIPLPTFCVDNQKAGAMAAEELIRRGHRRIGTIVGPIVNRSLQQRISGIKRTCEESGVTHHLVETGFGEKWINAGIATMLAAHPDITGVIAASGTTSLKAVSAIRMTGRSVPEDISVVGIGGEAVAQWNTTRLTRVDLALETCGQAAMDYIASSVSGGATQDEFHRDPAVVPGDTVAPR
jgi:LacI family transcriptional regulator